jgi:hypothetical protein
LSAGCRTLCEFSKGADFSAVFQIVPSIHPAIGGVHPEATQIRDTILDAGLEYGILRGIMDAARKITVEVPLALLEKAQRASGTGVTQTVRTGLQLLAASRTYARLRKLRGKVRFVRTLAELKADR